MECINVSMAEAGFGSSPIIVEKAPIHKTYETRDVARRIAAMAISIAARKGILTRHFTTREDYSDIPAGEGIEYSLEWKDLAWTWSRPTLWKAVHTSSDLASCPLPKSAMNL